MPSRPELETTDLCRASAAKVRAIQRARLCAVVDIIPVLWACSWKSVDGDWKCVKTVECGSAVTSCQFQPDGAEGLLATGSADNLCDPLPPMSVPPDRRCACCVSSVVSIPPTGFAGSACGRLSRATARRCEPPQRPAAEIQRRARGSSVDRRVRSDRGARAQVLSGHKDRVASCSFDPLNGDRAPRARSRSPPRAAPRMPMRGRRGRRRVIAARAAVLCSGSDDATVRVWRVSKAKQLRNFSGHKSPVTAVRPPHPTPPYHAPRSRG